MENQENSMRPQSPLSKREKISRSLSSAAVGLLVAGTISFAVARFMAKQAGDIDNSYYLEPILKLALWLLIWAFGFAVASLIKPNATAILVMLAAFIFEFWTFLYYVHLFR